MQFRKVSCLAVAMLFACGDGDLSGPGVAPAAQTVREGDGEPDASLEAEPEAEKGGEEQVVEEEQAPEEEVVEEEEQAPEEEVAEEEGDEIGLPCDVKAFLAKNCQKCHGPEAKNGTPLMTRADLLMASKRDANAKVIERLLMRVRDAEKPMPPMGKGDPVSDADLSILEAWFGAGAKAGSCSE